MGNRSMILLVWLCGVASEPSVCPAGAFCKAQSGAPEPCPDGHFCPRGSTEPHACPGKHFCSNQTATPQKCPAGYFCPAKSGKPTLCPSHHYCPEQSSEPRVCPEGFRCEGQDLQKVLRGSLVEALPWWKQLTASTEKFALAGGWGYSLAMVKGQLWAWGRNDHGQLGLGFTEHPVKVPSSKNFVAIAAGHRHSLALSDDGTLWTWGANSRGELGIGDTNDQLNPVQVAVGKKLVAIAAGHEHSLALSDDGTLWTWEHNFNGQPGLGNTINQLNPVQVAVGKNFVAIAAGGVHSLALSDDGTLWTWGANPVQVAVGKKFVAFAAGRAYSLALSDDGTLWTWGYNSYGELGIGNTNNQLNPVQVAVGKKLVAIAAGTYHSLALSDDGTLWTWGANTYGQLGTGNRKDQLNPVQVAVGKKFVAIAAGHRHSLALSDDGTLWTWGFNGLGQLGIGDTYSRFRVSPAQVAVGESLQFPNQFFLSAWCDPVASAYPYGACDVSAGSAFPCSSAFLKARPCSDSDGCSIFVGAKAAEPCDAGTFCPAGKGCAITCPEGHFCNNRAARPEPCAAGFVCPAGTSNRTGAADKAAAEEAPVAEEGAELPGAFSDFSWIKEQQPEDSQAKFEQTWPASLATELAQWYACLPFGTGMLVAIALVSLVAIALVSHFVEMIAKLVKNGRGGHRDFPVKMVVEDDRKVIAVHCPGVTIHDIRVEYYDGVSKGEIKIDRKEAQGVPSLQWGWTFHFDSHHEFVQSETRCEDGILRVSFKSVTPQPQVFRVPQVFHMALDDESEMSEGKISKAEKHEVMSVKSLAEEGNSIVSYPGSSWERCSD